MLVVIHNIMALIPINEYTNDLGAFKLQLSNISINIKKGKKTLPIYAMSLLMITSVMLLAIERKK